MSTRNVTKQLATMEDIAQGIGEVQQKRGPTDLVLHRMDLPYAVSSEAEMSALDVTVFTRARVYTSTTGFSDYIYDPLDSGGVPSTGLGTWVDTTIDKRILANATGESIYPSSVLSSASTSEPNNLCPEGTTALRDATTNSVYLTGVAVSGFITAIDFFNKTAIVGLQAVTLTLYDEDKIDQASGRAVYYDVDGANDYTLTPKTGQRKASSYFEGLEVRFKLVSANTGPSTVNLASLGVKEVKTASGGSLVGGELVGIVNLIYSEDLDCFQVLELGGSGAVGGGPDKMFYENDQVMTTDYTITAGKHAMSAGPITIADGVTLTIPDGSNYHIVGG